MTSASAGRVLLCGGGHAHLEVLRQLARSPDARQVVTLVSPGAIALYSGMLPGVIAGHHAQGDATIPLPPLVRAAGATFVSERIAGLDVDRRVARLASGGTLAFDVLSLDIGSAPDLAFPGARRHATPVRPFEPALAAFDRIRARAESGATLAIVIVGGGAAGVELAFALRYRLARGPPGAACTVSLVTDLPFLLPGHAPAVRQRVMRRLALRGIAVHLQSAALEVTRSGVRTASETIAADEVVIATSAVAQPWLAESGLACDARGFVRVGNTLQSVSHPFVFAAGDCAARTGDARGRSGVHAVRDGPTLARNLRRYARGLQPLAERPLRSTLALITTGERHAIASRPPFAAEGGWVWHWKDRIDRRYVQRYRAVP